VTAVYRLEERDLRVARQIYVLRTIGYKLHKTTSRHFILNYQKKILQNVIFCKIF
jgi:hypothetical protein